MTTTPAPVREKSAAELFGVRTQPRNARDRLLDTAVDLFYAEGFHAVGLDRILHTTGVTKTTFYKHFECKDDLIVQAIRKMDLWERKAWDRALRRMGGRTPRQKLLAMFDVLDLWFNDPEFGGCLFLNAAAEFPNPHDPVHQAAAAHKRHARDTVRDLAQAAGAADPDAFADLYITVFEGTLVVRHVHGRNDAARIARRLVQTLVAEQLGAGTDTDPAEAPSQRPPTPCQTRES